MGLPDKEDVQPLMTTTTFDEREKALEAKYVHDEELKFLALARRDKLFALWAVGRLGLSGPDRDAFIGNLLAVQGFPRHDEALLRFAVDALTTSGAVAAAHDAAATLEQCGKQAQEQLMHGGAKPIDLSAPHSG
jgi:hypothetical protein